jgi:UDP-3-O-acyl N-acetylglucosamine deacetylase
MVPPDAHLSLRQQNTIAQPAAVRGFGYWSGRDVCVEFAPAEPDTGLVFIRRDLDRPCRIGARVQNRIDMPRRTCLEENGVRVEMVEHVMAALAGLQIDNCEITVDAPEMPGCDGSSQAYVVALLSAGLVSQAATRAQLVIRETICVGDRNAWVEARPARQPGLSLRCRIDYGRNSAIGEQAFTVAVSPPTFRRELADSRTFLLKPEAEWLRAQGLGHRTSYRDLLVFDDQGPIDNTLRYDDECARHKTLDLVGDLALAGCDLVGEIVADRSGHRLNAELVKTLLANSSVSHPVRQCA